MTCAALLFELPAPGQMCCEPMIGTLVGGCVHEHCPRLPLCAGCATDIQHLVSCAYELVCQACRDHDCRLVAYIEWLDGSPRTVLQDLFTGS